MENSSELRRPLGPLLWQSIVRGLRSFARGVWVVLKPVLQLLLGSILWVWNQLCRPFRWIHSKFGAEISLKLRFGLIALSFLVFTGLVVFRAFQIQMVGDARLARLIKRQFQSKILLQPQRGSIVDRHGEPLAINIEVSSLAAHPSKIRQPKRFSRDLAKILRTGVPSLYEKMKSGKNFIWLKRHLSDSELRQLQKWILKEDLRDAFFFVKEKQRMYPHGKLAAPVLGMVNVDSEGIEGIEYWLDAQLRGRQTKMQTTPDGLRRSAFLDVTAANDLQDGDPVALTIDAPLQFAVEKELKEALQKTSARSASALVMDAETGEILVMAQEPGFDPNLRTGPMHYRRNRLVTDGFEPGSTLKPILIAGALQQGWDSKQLVWGGWGQLDIRGMRISEAESTERFTWLSLRKIIEVSSNVGAAKVALKLGANKVLSILRKFGFAQKTALSFPGEISGYLPPAKNLQPHTLASLGFGQALLVTPLQVARAYASFLNGGLLVEPRLIQPTQNSKAPPPVLPKKILDPKVVQSVQEALVGATSESGTGSLARLPGYRVAGKTGTAQTVDSKTGKYSTGDYIASFAGFALDVNPKLVILVIIEAPQGVYYASHTAAPLFRQVLQAATNRYSIPSKPELEEEYHLSQKRALAKIQLALKPSEVSSEGSFKVSSDGLNWVAQLSGGKNSWKMPDFKHYSIREVLRLVQGHDFKVSVKGSGLVVSQKPAPSAIIDDGQEITLHCANP